METYNERKEKGLIKSGDLYVSRRHMFLVSDNGLYVFLPDSEDTNIVVNNAYEYGDIAYYYAGDITEELYAMFLALKDNLP